ncbi:MULTISPECIES: ABC transporter ATP-binding protein [unclassified Sporolactobacillus]|uniref:ABC transporter ATP-binding protein n=1 Tax=unclassified Sporolactobacillus TaxID=2628533 RepID=UPI002368E04B|nr:ABC transporter ATP-binding protein [Sporolactobacillus sp. CQH2019]MDD9149704.1 ABC transporter ATP-binding protein [Sporolactobacillus sp. CQH2019]
MPVIELRHISKYFGKFAAVKDLSLTVEPGELFGFIGPNGAGKSTTMNMTLNFIKHNGGNIKLFGKDMPGADVAVKKRIGYVPSDVRFYPQLRVHDLIRYTLDFHHLDEDKEELKKYCKLFDIDLKKKFGELSLGNKKKVAIVCAMIHNPELLILDEPTNGLDPLMHARLFRLLKEKQKQGVTVFLSSHNLKEVEDYCSKVAFIKAGHLVGVEDLTTINKKVKIITLQGASLPIERMEAIGAQCIRHGEREARFVYEKELAPLFALLSELSHDLDDVTVDNRDLEEQFMSMYENQEAERV